MSQPKMSKWKSFKEVLRKAFGLKRKGSESTKKTLATRDLFNVEIEEEYPEQYIYQGRSPQEPSCCCISHISHECVNAWKFDVAWELGVSNLKGDIEDLNANYVVVAPYRPINGPYNNATAKDDVIITELPVDSPLFIAVQSMRLEGHNVITGRLKIPAAGSPWVVMFDLTSAAKEVSDRFQNEIQQDPYLQLEEMASVMSLLVSNEGFFEHLVDRFFFHFKQEIALRSVLAGSIQDSIVTSKDVLSRCSSMISLSHLAHPESETEFF